jgi:formiminotetrahydrofolate cyclodeaminase
VAVLVEGASDSFDSIHINNEVFAMTSDQLSPSFLDDLAKPRPDPGGGSAAAYAALVALALGEKVTRLELGRCRPEEIQRRFWGEQLHGIMQLQQDFSRLCNRDVLAYQQVARALAGRAEPDQRQAAVEGAIECPREMMATVRVALATAQALGTQCRQHLVGDVLVAIELLGAVLLGAQHIAVANVPWLEESQEQTAMFEGLHKELREGLDHLAAVRDELAGRLLVGARPEGAA